MFEASKITTFIENDIFFHFQKGAAISNSVRKSSGRHKLKEAVEEFVLLRVHSQTLLVCTQKGLWPFPLGTLFLGRL